MPDPSCSLSVIYRHLFFFVRVYNKKNMGQKKMILAAGVGIVALGLLVTLLAVFLKPKCKEDMQAFDGYQDAPTGVKPVPAAFPQQTTEQRTKAIRFADKAYVKEYGGPFGSGRERMVPTGSKIKSSPGYGHRPPPPATSVSSQVFDEYPAVPTSSGIVYREVRGQTCAVNPMSSSMSMILDSCNALCSHDNQCLGYSYDFSNGNCLTYPTCDATKTASNNSKLFVKSKIERQMK